eukprot:TRINITY_DN1239_c0_g2_i2.p1 TRINITY_DN1239_c0_g2~~TRINITY_DN1239_c0_g2_i2.p1  ORF type:complete len:491 (-),score=121.12 TRINITY_DN1239_c0_g2_i2:286-1689(-)
MFYSTRTLFTPANRALFNSSKQTNFHLVHATQVQARALTQTRPTVPTVEFTSLTPKELVEMIDKYVVGQDEAKLAVASALRNRWRRSKLTESQRKEIMPKNILMTGPTGVGKTEIARRVAKLCNAPFVRVEATRYTEVGFKGADVETMIVDLVEAAIRTVRERHMEFHAAASKANVEQLILTALLGPPLPEERGTRESLLEFLRRGDLDDIMVPYQNKKGPDLFNDFFGIQQQSPKKSKVAVRDIRTIEENLELKRLMDEGEIVRQALYEVEEYGIVFIDELDKIVRKPNKMSGDASDEGVQRDLLPIIEGAKVQTKYGQVDTSKILFIGAGAFLSVKPTDLLAELQGRLPIHIPLKPLTEEDFLRILTEPETNLIRQHKALLKTEGVDLRFTYESLKEISRMAIECNRTIENLGARRMHAILEKVVADVSFNASKYANKTVVFDKEDVEKMLEEFKDRKDSQYYFL